MMNFKSLVNNNDNSNNNSNKSNFCFLFDFLALNFRKNFFLLDHYKKGNKLDSSFENVKTLEKG